MEAKAQSKHVGVAASKVRLVINNLRGKRVDEALAVLRFTPTPLAKLVAKAVKSAAANGENNMQMDPAKLRIVDIRADEGRRLKRWHARSRGRVSPLLRRSSHITVVVSEEK